MSNSESFSEKNKEVDRQKKPLAKKILIVVIALLVLLAGWLFYRELQKQTKIEVWGTSGSTNTQEVEKNLATLKNLFGSRLQIDLHLTASLNGEELVSALYGQAAEATVRLDLTENERQLVIQKYYPQKFWDYLDLRNTAPTDPTFERYAQIAKINDSRIRKLVDEGKGKELLKKSAEEWKTLKEKEGELNIPAIFINGKLYDGAYDFLSLAAATVKPILRVGKDQLNVWPRWTLFGGSISIGLPSRFQNKGISECYSELDCDDRLDKDGSCVDVNTEKARCEYTQAKEVALTVLTDDECLSCNEEDIIKSLKRDFKGLTESYVDIDSEEGVKLAEQNGITLLPSYIFAPEVAESKAYSAYTQAQVLSQLADGSYLFTSGTPFIALERQYIEGNLDVFAMSMCKFSNEAMKAIIGQAKEKQASGAQFPKISVNYVLPFELDDNNNPQIKLESLGGDDDLNEDKRQLVVQKYYPDKFYDYFIARLENITDKEGWKKVAGDLGINTTEMENRFASEGEALLLENAKKGAAIGLQNVPAFLRNNVEIVNTVEDLKRIPGLENLNLASENVGYCTQSSPTDAANGQ